jgi:hypothetical protein
LKIRPVNHRDQNLDGILTPMVVIEASGAILAAMPGSHSTRRPSTACTWPAVAGIPKPREFVARAERTLIVAVAATMLSRSTDFRHRGGAPASRALGYLFCPRSVSGAGSNR